MKSMEKEFCAFLSVGIYMAILLEIKFKELEY